ncbi:AEC family transporter [Oceaniglobus ichthyenteri]|uniref:AEC family transporter n=1 Tax=Oceaniglobus ichthyenteri TaxID=2136177 RepID=UPI000D3975A6|nr:AEC family transporter [Oceaniglobus ichthyenteri]
MNLILTVAEVVAPVFALATIGFVWVKLGFEYRIQFVTRLAMTLSVPCLIFVALMQAEIEPSALTTLSLATVAAYASVTVVMAAIALIGRLEIRTYLAPLVFGNTGNVGLPLALFAFGDQGLGLAVVVFAIMAIYSFTAGIWIVSGGGSPLKAVKEPLVAASILGVIFLWMDWETPRVITNTLSLIGQIAIPIMLITLGVAVARLSPGRLGQAVVLSALKIVVCIGLAWAIGRWFELPPVAFAVLVLQLGTPIAVTSYMLAEKYGADSNAVAGLVVVSTLMSVVALPVTLAFVM